MPRSHEEYLQYQREYYCKNKQKRLAQQKQYYQDNKEARLDYARGSNQQGKSRDRSQSVKERLDAIKAEAGCSVCYERDASVLDFHHTDPGQKEFHVSMRRLSSWDRIQAEVDKCVVICANCHARTHIKAPKAPGLVSTGGQRAAYRRKKWFWDIKSGLSCERCGTQGPEAIQFHHRDPDQKTAHVSALVNKSTPISVILEEIHKCDILCANCHRKWHAEERSS